MKLRVGKREVVDGFRFLFYLNPGIPWRTVVPSRPCFTQAVFWMMSCVLDTRTLILTLIVLEKLYL